MLSFYLLVLVGGTAILTLYLLATLVRRSARRESWEGYWRGTLGLYLLAAAGWALSLASGYFLLQVLSAP